MSVTPSASFSTPLARPAAKKQKVMAGEASARNVNDQVVDVLAQHRPDILLKPYFDLFSTTSRPKRSDMIGFYKLLKNPHFKQEELPFLKFKNSLPWAFQHNQPGIFKQLLKVPGIVIKAQNAKHQTALTMAVNKNVSEAVKLLLEHYDKPNVKKDDVITALKLACQKKPALNPVEQAKADVIRKMLFQAIPEADLKKALNGEDLNTAIFVCKNPKTVKDMLDLAPTYFLTRFLKDCQDKIKHSNQNLENLEPGYVGISSEALAVLRNEIQNDIKNYTEIVQLLSVAQRSKA